MKIILLLLILLLAGCSSQNETQNSSNEVANTSRLSAVQNTAVNNTDQNNTAQNSTNVGTGLGQPAKTPTQLSTFTTTIYTKTASRQNNVRIACSELNGTTVSAGETFSFTSTLGPANPSDGYQKADTFDQDGDIIQEYGGGKCQISSTLYNAVLAVPELVVVERHEHSNDVPYVEEGKDAAIAYGSVDFKFRNDTGSTVRIDASCTDDDITVSIYKI